MGYWYNLSIRKKLITYFFIISFFGAIINLYLQDTNFEVMDQFDKNLTNYYLINQLIVATRDNQTAMDTYLKTMNSESEIKYQETKLQINELISELDGRFNSTEIYFTMNAIKYSVEAYLEKWDHSMQLRKDGESQYFVDYYRGVDVYAYTEQYVQELLYSGLEEGLQLYNDLVQKTQSLRTISQVTIVATFVLSLFFGGVFSSYLIAPIKKLAESSIKISHGQLDVELMEVNSNDEVGILSDSFNIMSASIRSLVNDLLQKAAIEKRLHEEEIELIKMQQLLQEAEFLALQSQINPHFLFNTLNTISRTAMFEGAADTIKLIGALSSIFRFSLRNTGKSISLNEEIDMIEQYMYLQNFRFKQRLQFVIKCSDALTAFNLPVFTIQPLVENAIIHGIEPKVEGGTVRLKIYETKKAIYIKVLDTGVGMTKERLAIITREDQRNDTKSIGLNNVFSRFKIYFGEESQITIRSRLGLGTLIIMAIPKG